MELAAGVSVHKSHATLLKNMFILKLLRIYVAFVKCAENFTDTLRAASKGSTEQILVKLA